MSTYIFIHWAAYYGSTHTDRYSRFIHEATTCRMCVLYMLVLASLLLWLCSKLGFIWICAYICVASRFVCIFCMFCCLTLPVFSLVFCLCAMCANFYAYPMILCRNKTQWSQALSERYIVMDMNEINLSILVCWLTYIENTIDDFRNCNTYLFMHQLSLNEQRMRNVCVTKEATCNIHRNWKQCSYPICGH